jgi:hypothetical protein
MPDRPCGRDCTQQELDEACHKAEKDTSTFKLLTGKQKAKLRRGTPYERKAVLWRLYDIKLERAIQQALACIADGVLAISTGMSPYLELKPAEGTLSPRQRDGLVMTLNAIKISLGEEVLEPRELATA